MEGMLSSECGACVPCGMARGGRSVDAIAFHCSLTAASLACLQRRSVVRQGEDVLCGVSAGRVHEITD